MLSLLRPDLNLADLSRLMAESDDERARQTAVQRARDYHSGRHFVKLTPRQREYLQDTAGGQDSDYLRLNIARTVVLAVVERLRIQQIASPDDAMAAFCQAVYARSGGAPMADDAHEWATRDGEAFVLVEVGADGPRFVVHPRYVDAALDDPLGTSFGLDSTARTAYMSGQGFGCVAHYPDDDLSRAPTHIVKRWQDTDERGRSRQRLTVYYPDRVEKYVLTPRREQVQDPGDPGWPIPLIYRGQPLGIPVIHLFNPGASCEAWEAIPIQNAVNKTLVDLLAAGDLSAFRILFAAGWMPTTDGRAPDGTNGLPVNPGQWVGSTNPEAKMQAVEGADLAPIADTIDRLVQWAAMVTDTPVARFTVTRQVAAASTIKAQEGPLVAKVEKRQAMLGKGWADAYRIAARLAAVYAPATLAGASPDAEVTIDWAPAATPDPTADMELLRTKREVLRIPLPQLWREAGYTEAQIDQMTRDRDAEDARQAAPFTPTPGGNTAVQETATNE